MRTIRQQQQQQSQQNFIIFFVRFVDDKRKCINNAKVSPGTNDVE